MTSPRPARDLPVFSLLAALLLALAACAPEGVTGEDLRGEADGGSSWVSGDVDERFQAIGDQFGGFSQAMIEVGHRYGDFHWAVADGNWDYATYQVEKMRDAVARGIIRRPGRAESAETYFLDEGGAVDEMLEALDSGDAERVRAQVEEFTAACNNCHVAEDMGYIQVGPPAQRTTVVRPPDP